MNVFVDESGRKVNAMLVDLPSQLKSELAPFGVLAATMTYPTGDPITFVGLEPPLAMNGKVASPGQYVLVGEAGDVDVLPARSFAEKYTEVAS